MPNKNNLNKTAVKKESIFKRKMTLKFNKDLERSLLNELFKKDITIQDENGIKQKISSIEAGIKRLKKIMLSTKNEKLSVDIFFKFMERMFGKPVETVEASVETEHINYSRDDVIKMILDARENKTITVVPEETPLIENEKE